MPTTYIIANWKTNKNPRQALQWLEEVKTSLPNIPPSLQLVVCLPFIHLHLFKNQLQGFALGVQNISPYPDGAYTGEISARMIKDEVKFVLLGHSERRQYFNETSTQVSLKATQCLEHGLTPIISISHETWDSQLNQISDPDLAKCLIMYEPPEAISVQVGPIGTGDSAPISDVVVMVKKIIARAPSSPVLYGGSIKSHNLDNFLNQPQIHGVVVGSASLNSAEWLKIVNTAIDLRG